MDKENKLILYKDEESIVNVNVRFADEDVWLTRENLAEIYATTPQNITLYIENIYQDKELSEEGTRKKFFLVRQEGKRQVQREIDHYNLDMIIALGYHVQSPIAVRFRRWLTQLQLAEIYSTTKQNVNQHIDNILADGEVEGNRTVKNFLTVSQKGCQYSLHVSL